MATSSESSEIMPAILYDDMPVSYIHLPVSDHKVIQGHSLHNELQADKGLHIVLLAVSPKFSKT